MNKLETRRLKALTKNFLKQSKKAETWIKRNYDKCGHSNTDDALGDEGWIKAHQLGGEASAFFTAYIQLNNLIDELNGEKND